MGRPSSESWQRIDLPELGLSSDYPRLTADGQDVVVDDLRIHIRSRDGRQVKILATLRWR